MSFTGVVKREYKFLNDYYVERKFRKILPPVVSGLITSEDASIHWKHLDVAGKVVLDLGCGLWDANDPRESSPIYFKNEGAKRIIGVDSNEKDINTLKKYFDECFPNDGSEFFVKEITTTDDLLHFLSSNQVESIKCDIEGFESVMFNLDKSQVKNIINIAVEYHNRELFLGLVKTLKKWGFKIIDHSLFTYAPQNMGVLTAKPK